VLYLTDPGDAALLATIDIAEIAITSGARVALAEGPPDAFRLSDVSGVAAQFLPAEGKKCARCWMILPEVGTVPRHDDLCRRCGDAVDHFDESGA
jgi:isoleucyl-tRNA synthetase